VAVGKGKPVIRWVRLLLDFGPPLLVIVMIFVASQDMGSAAHSGRIIGRILLWLGLAERLSPAQFAAVHHAVRKAGHVTEYAILAILSHRAVARGRERWSPRLALGLLVVVSLYAATDEIHQRFVATRTPSPWDWMLDTAAAGLALGIKWKWERRWKGRSSE
jgi:VanZ family protein